MNWMEWNREVDRDRDALMRILAMLVSFAGLADRLCSLPPLARRDLLIPLRRAEACLQEFVFTKVHGFSLPLPRDAYVALSLSIVREADDDARLAASFRALAIVLTAMLEQAERLGRTTNPGFRDISGTNASSLLLVGSLVNPELVEGLAGWGSLQPHTILVPP